MGRPGRPKLPDEQRRVQQHMRYDPQFLKALRLRSQEQKQSRARLIEVTMLKHDRRLNQIYRSLSQTQPNQS